MLEIKKRKRARVETFKVGLVEIQDEIRRAGKKSEITRWSLRETFDKHGGRCVYCGMGLLCRGDGPDSAHFSFYVPLNNGGLPVPENLVLVCYTHRKTYLPNRINTPRILDVNTIPDLIVALVEAVKEFGGTAENEILAKQERIKILKRELNLSLEDLALTMRYKVVGIWRPKEFVVVEEGVNTFAEQVLEPKAEELKQTFQQIVTTGKYKIIR